MSQSFAHLFNVSNFSTLQPRSKKKTERELRNGALLAAFFLLIRPVHLTMIQFSPSESPDISVPNEGFCIISSKVSFGEDILIMGVMEIDYHMKMFLSTALSCLFECYSAFAKRVVLL